MSEKKLRVAIIGMGAMGQVYANAYKAYPETELVAFAEYRPDRLKYVGEKYGVKALYKDAQSLFRDIVPDIASVVLPAKYIKDAVIAAAEACVKGVSTDKPMEATLSAADQMVETCASRGVIFSGGALIRANPAVQETADWIRQGRFGRFKGAIVDGWGGEISGSGCHGVSVLRLYTNAEVTEVMGWGWPQDALASGCDADLYINGRFVLSNGWEVPVFGQATPGWTGIKLWNDSALIVSHHAAPEIYQGFDRNGERIKLQDMFKPYPWGYPDHLHGALRSFIAAVQTHDAGKLWISGHDLRQALEVAVASRESARRGGVPMKLPLQDRSLTLYPRPYRWLGGDMWTFEGKQIEGQRPDINLTGV